MKRFFSILISSLFTSLLASVLIIIWLVYTNTGLNFILKTLPLTLPGQLKIGSIEGKNLTDFTLNNVSYYQKNIKFTLKKITVTWMPEKLIFHQTVDVEFLHLEDLNISMLSQSSSRENAFADVHFSSLLPEYWQVKFFKLDHIVYQNISIPDSEGKIEAEIKNHSLLAYQISEKILKGNLNIVGHIILSPGLRWQFIMNANRLNFSELPLHIPSNIAFELTSEGEKSKQSFSFNTILSHLNGQINHYPIEGAGKLLIDNHHFQLSDLYIHSANNFIQANADLKQTWQGSWKLSLHDFSEYIPHSSGKLICQGNITGERNLPRFNITFNGEKIHLNSPSININHLFGKAEGTLNHHQVYFKLQENQLHLNLNLEGRYAFSHWTGKLKQFNFANPSIGSWKLSQPATLQINPEKFILHNFKFKGYKSYGILDAEWEKDKNWALLASGNFYINPLNIMLTNTHIKIFGNPQQAIYNSYFLSDNGNLHIQGKASFVTTPFLLEATIQGNHFLAINTSHYKVWASPSLQLKKINDQWHINGKLMIPEAHIISPDYKQKTVVLPKEVIIEDNLKQPKDNLLQLYSDIQLILGNKIDIQAEGLDATLIGFLRLQDAPQHPTVGNGTLTIIKGRYHAYGQTLQIPEGRLLFNHSPVTNPILQIKAVKQVIVLGNTTSDLIAVSVPFNQKQKVTVGVNVSGTLDEPQMSLFSSPIALPQPDILSYILFEKPLNLLSPMDAALLVRATTAMNLGNSQFEQILHNIKNITGLEKLSIESVSYMDSTASSMKETTSLALGKALSPKLYLSYSIGLLDPINILTVKYLISDQWILQSTSSSLATGLDLFYSSK